MQNISRANTQRNGASFIIVNNTPTELDDEADAVIRAPIGETLRLLARLLQRA